MNQEVLTYIVDIGVPFFEVRNERSPDGLEDDRARGLVLLVFLYYGHSVVADILLTIEEAYNHFLANLKGGQ